MSGREEGRLRAVDLARTAGISVQQVRTYVATGILPPVERAANGYRVFTVAHVEALAAAREVAAGHGWTTARAVMRAVHEGDLETALAALDASHARLDRERAELAAVRDMLSTALAGEGEGEGEGEGAGGAAGKGQGRAAVPVVARRGMRIGEAARTVGVRPPVLRLWEARGLLRPDREPGTGYRRYAPAELRAAQVVALLRRGGNPLAAIDAVMREFRTAGSPDRVLGELSHRARDLRRRSLNRLGASAALHAYLRYLGHAT
ncbi:MerR family transcriptional regulator [Streptomyces sp. NRRL F-5135]|uniref:MerR family transcriptional regulator n=1 Tax=Streptomyces sp. NRRL F-5135 TaxID=1463858 RepID=UPI0004C78E56|nr:MerR family transcriptional regulator [Streptomyces sp. NRRL F-5135]